jgi:hypothetical protein
MMAASLSLSPWNNSAVPPLLLCQTGLLDETTINNTVIQTISYQL